MYKSLESCLLDLEKHQQLIRVKESVDPYLEMASIQLRLYEKKAPAVLFENVKGTPYRAACNIFGTLDRSKFIFRKTLSHVKNAIAIRNNPADFFKKPFAHISSIPALLNAIPHKNIFKKSTLFKEISISDLPQIHHWQMDGGAYITLPQVYTENLEKPGIMHSNLGMYRVQLSGNAYEQNAEIGMHYQIHRGIGIHQKIAQQHHQPLKVSIFVGGPPAHTLAAVMPLPEHISEITFAGLLAGRRFRYFYQDGYCISADADFVITGELYPNDIKPEGPFGDHYGYYSLTHDFPVMKVHKVYAKANAIWPFTVVGRPPQEDTSFGALIHEITGNAISAEIPGVKEVHAVDAAGVHPLLFAIGSERYTPYIQTKRPAEIITIANRILGTGQLSLAKYLYITADVPKQLNTHNVQDFLTYIFERIDWRYDIHFHTQLPMDTLDYTGTGLNEGSKVVFAAYGEAIRQLDKEIPLCLKENTLIKKVRLVMPGVIAIETQPFTNYSSATAEFIALNNCLKEQLASLKGIAQLIVCDDADFTAASIKNFVWITYTRSNPSHDIYGIDSYTQHKHFGCNGPLIIDARTKPHHAPPLILNEEVEKNVDKLFEKGGSLYHWR